MTTDEIDHEDLAQRRAQRRITLLGMAGIAVLVGMFLAVSKWANLSEARPWVRTVVALGYLAGVYGVAAAMASANARAGCAPMTTAARRYGRRVGIAMVLYALVFVGVKAYTAGHMPVEGALAWALAVAPTAPLLGVLAVMALYLKEEQDDFQRSLQLESALWASLVLLAIATVWGFLQEFRLADAPQLWMAFPVWAVLMAMARGIIARRYR